MPAMPQGLPGVATPMFPSGMPIGTGTADWLTPSNNQRVWWILRHRKTATSALTGGSLSFFDAATPNALDGNVERPNSIPSPQIFIVFGIGIRFDARALVADVKLIMDSFNWTLEINNRKDFGPVNTAHLPGGGGVVTATVAGAVNGLQSPQYIGWLPIPVVIQASEFFKFYADVGVTLAALSADTALEASFHGILMRRPTDQ